MEILAPFLEACQDPILILTFDGDPQIQTGNQAASSLLGIEKDQLSGKPLSALFSTDTVLHVTSNFKKALQGEKVRFEWNIGSQDYLTRAAPLHDDFGKAAGVFFINHQKRKSIEHSLQERLKEINCLYAVSRDMRQVDDQDVLCKKIIEHLIPAAHYPEIAAPHLTVDKQSYTSDQYHNSLDHFLSSSIVVFNEVKGSLKLYYTEEKPFLLPEEQNLLDGISEALGLWLEHKSEQRRLEQREKRFQALVKNAPDGIALLGRDGKFNHLSPAVTRILGYDPQQDLLKDPAQLTHPEDEPELSADLTRLQEQPGESITRRYRFQAKDGSYRWLESTITNLFHIPEVEALVFNYRDITDRLEAEKSLQRRERRFRHLIENIVDVITVIDQNGIIQFQSPSAQEVFGFSPEEQIGKPIWEFIHPDDIKHSQVLLNDVVQKPDSSTQIVTRMPTKGGEYIIIESRGVNKLADPAVQGIVVTSRDVTNREKAKQRISRQAEELSLLLDSSLALGAALEQEQIARILSGNIHQLISPNGFSMLQYHTLEDQVETIYRAADGKELVENLEAKLPLNQCGLVSQVIQNGKAIKKQLPDEDDLPPQLHFSDEQPHCWMGIPLISGGQILGAITAYTTQQRCFSERDSKLMASLGAQAAIALNNANLFQSTQEQMERLESLQEIDRAISGSMHLETTLNILLGHLVSSLQVDAAVIHKHEPGAPDLTYMTSTGFRTEAPSLSGVKLGRDLAGRAALQRETLFVPNLSLETISRKRALLLQKEGFVSYVGVPLLAKGKLQGVLEVFHRSHLEPYREWLDFLETLANQAAIAIDNITLFNNLERTNLTLQQAYNAVIQGWAKALELRDTETEGHSRRVVGCTLEIARAMGISKQKLIHIRQGALLHDIGKMGVPDAILQKPDKLTAEEWEIMKQHPRFAYNLLSTIDYLKPALEIPYSHHEKWDGSGYPRGLKGPEIPLAARIFAVVDVWDALRSDRPYRKAWSKEKVLAYIREQSGKHFDPEVVEVFLNLLKEEPCLDS